MTKITLAHSDLTNTIYAIVGKEKIDITEQAVAEVRAIKALEQEPCEDAISRQAVLAIVGDSCLDLDSYEDTKEFCDEINELPSVNPQEPKTGHWIDVMVGDMPAQACDQCNTFYPLTYTGGGHKYCPNCGAEMRGEEE